MAYKDSKKPLYRKVNTKARGVHHNFGTDYRDTKSTKRVPSTKMKQGVRRGLDYTPLYKFLLSKVGEPYSEVHSEASSRIDRSDYPDVINNMVVDSGSDEGYFRYGESTYYSTLYVDKDGLLQLVDPTINPNTFEPFCPCCTHTLNGKIVNKKYNPSSI